jgi:hypothetical protein
MKWFTRNKKQVAIITILLLFSQNIYITAIDECAQTRTNNNAIQYSNNTDLNNTPESILKADPSADNTLRALGDPYNAFTTNGTGALPTWTDPAQWVGTISTDLSGFVDQTSSTIEFIDGTHTFSITPSVALTPYYVYYQGKCFTKATTETFTINNAIEGMHYICFDSTGTLVDLYSFPNF